MQNQERLLTQRLLKDLAIQMSQEDGSYFDVPFCRIDEDIYPLSNLAESERENLIAQKSDSSKLITSPGIVLQGKVKERKKYSNKVAKQLIDIGVDIDLETGLESTSKFKVIKEHLEEDKASDTISVSSSRAAQRALILEDLADTVLASLRMDQEQDTGFSDWDPMKASYEQKHFNTYSKAQYDANFTEKHAAVRGSISPAKGDAEEVRLFVANIPLTLTEDGMMNLFSQVGKCKDVKRCSPKGNSSTTYGFVTYNTVHEAERAIIKFSGFKFGGKYTLRVSLARNSRNNTSFGGVEQIWRTPGTSDGENSFDNQSKTSSGAQEVSSILQTPLEKPRLYVHALTVDTTPEELKSLFQSVGTPTDPVIVPPTKPRQFTTYGFISLSNIEEANAGIEKYHNFVYKGKTLKVEFTNNSTKGYKGKTAKNEDEKFYDALYDSNPFEDDELQETGEVEKNTNKEQLSPKIQTTMTPEIKESVKSPGGRCNYCGNVTALKKCSRCKIPYCNRECQEFDWKEHKVTCVMTVDSGQSNNLSDTKYNVTKSLSLTVDMIPPSECLHGTFKIYFPVFNSDCSLCGVKVCHEHSHYIDDLVAMEDSFKKYTGSQGDVDLRDVQKGLLIIAKLNDEDWGRAVITDAPKDVYFDSVINIMFIDCGLHSTVKAQDLIYLTNDLVSLPKQMAHVCLGSGKANKLTSGDIIYLNKVVQGKALNVSLREPSSDEAFIKEASMNCTLNEFLNDFLESKKMNEKDTRPSCSNAIRGMMLKDLPVKPFPDETEFEICCTEVVSPELFYGQLLDESCASLAKLSEKINEIYSDPNNNGKPYTPSVNEICAAKFIDGGWYRASVVNYNADGTARMFFIDFGNKADIEAADIRSIDQELLNYPRFALRFALDGVLTLSGDHAWTTDANELIQEKIVNKRSFVKTKSVDGETLVCDISIESGEDLRQLLETKKLAVGRRCLFQDLPQEKIDMAKENIDAFGMYTESPHELYVWLGDLMKHNSEVEEITATLASLNRGSIYEPCLRELCAGFVEIPGVGGQWYRVVVEEINPNSVLVQLIDYGNRAEVKFTDITALPNEPPVLKVASKAYKVALDLCCFDQEWSAEAINFIKGQTEFQKLVVEIVNDKEQPISVKISTATGDDIVELFIKSNFGRRKSRGTFTKKFHQSDLPNQQITANDLSIIVRHVRDPWLINGQLNEPDKIRHIKEIIAKSTSSKTVYPVEVEEICAGFSIKYGEWHRVLIESISENSANVELIDFGDTEQIALTKLAPLPEELSNIPIQSVSCYIDDIAPPNSDRWSPQIKKELEELLLNNSSNIHISSIDENQAMHCSMTVKKESVSNILVSRDLAKWKNNGCQTAVEISSTRPTSKDLLTIKLPDEKTAVALVEFKSPAEFYLQLFDNIMKSNELSNSLLEKYKEDFASYIPVVDEICAGYFPSFEQFYRVRVLSIHEKTATVLAVDFGSLEDIPTDDIKPLSAEFLTLPQQAIRVGLYNKDAIEWSNDAMKHFILNCMDTKMYCVVKERESAAGVLVQLIHAEHGDVIEYLCKNGFARQTNETREPPKSRPESVPAPAAPTETLLNNFPSRNLDKFTKMPILEVPDFCEVMVTHVENMSLFYVLDIKNGEEFNDLVVFMNNYCNEHPKHSYCPHVDELCCAFSCEAWNRAYVQEVKSSKARVYFIDFGNTEELEFDKLRPFSDELLSLPSVAIPASFLEHEVSTNPTALDEFKSICKEQLLTMNVLSRDENTLKVSLSYSGTDILEMLKLKFEEPCHEEVQKTVAVERITEEVATKANSAGETTKAEEEVIPNVAAETVETISPSAAETAVLEGDIIKTPVANNSEIELPAAEAETKLKTAVDEISTDSTENNSYTSTENDVLSRLPNSCHPYESVTLKLPRCTFPNAVERMFVTKIYTPYLIFGYLEKRREEIDKLSLDLEEYSKQSQADEQIPRKAGTLCVVQDDDAKFRRGVLKTVTRTNSVVFMFDIGIEKSVPHTELKVLDKKFKNVMNVQGIPMKLLQVRPSNDQNEWSEEAIKALKDIIEGQVVRVLPKFTESFIVNVKMKIDNNNDPVEKLFEDTGHAEVFQPVITEQMPSSSNAKKGVPMEKIRELIQLQKPPVNVKNFEIKVTCSVSPSLFYGQLYDKHNFEKCFKLSDELKELIEEGGISQEEKATINIDKLCIVKFSDNNYYRGYVIEKAGLRVFYVFLIDYGIKERVLTENLWPLPEAHVKYPAQSMLFQLQFITPPKRAKANVYSKEACEVFESLVRAKRMNVELIKTHGYVYRVVIRDHQTGVDIGERLIELGHAEHLFPKSKLMKHPYKDRSYFSSVSPRALLEETPPQSLMSSYVPARARRGNTKQVRAERCYDHEYGNYHHYQNGYQNGYDENYNQYQYKQQYPSQRMGRQEFYEGDYYREEPNSNRGRYQGRAGNHGQHQQATNFKGRGATSQPPQRGVRGRGKFFYNQNTDEKDRSSSHDSMNGDITRYVNEQVNPYNLNGHDQGHCDHNGPSRGQSNYHSNYHESTEYSSAHHDSKFPSGGKFNHQPRQRASGKFRGRGGTGRGRGSFSRDVSNI